MEKAFDPGRPIWSQVCDRVRNAIIVGKYAPDQRLPGVRDLAAEYAVNPNTMQRALAYLESEGMIVTRGTSGRYVAADGASIGRARDMLLKRAASDYLNVCRSHEAKLDTAIKLLKEVSDEQSNQL